MPAKQELMWLTGREWRDVRSQPHLRTAKKSPLDHSCYDGEQGRIKHAGVG